jgi:hypothetical protein
MESSTTWVYVFLGLYIVYCFYWGLKGYFTEKDILRLRNRRPVHSLFRVSSRRHGRVVQWMDLYRSSGSDLA